MIWAWSRFLIVAVVVASVQSGLVEDSAKGDRAMRPKVKRAQEILMFGNQQNRRIESPGPSDTFQSPAEKRTLGTSGLEDVKAALADEEAYSAPKQPTNSMMDRETLFPYEKNYLYGKVMVNEASDDMPRSWELPPYPRYYNYGEDRRKRSDKPSAPTSTTIPPSATSASPIPATQGTSRPLVQAKRSPPIYPELRYKRGLDRDELLALLSFWENGARRNYRNYGNDEYETGDDDMAGLEDEDPRAGGAWLEAPVYAPHHFSLGPSDLGIPRTHPVNEQYGTQYAGPYENTQYGAAQYGSMYPQHPYYQPEKRFMVSRKRAQGYDSYNGRNLNDVINFSQMMNSQPQGYPSYPQRLLY